MWAEYLKEREDLDTVKTEHGFATYKVMGTECYLRDIYVKPEYRKTGEAKKLSEMVRQEAIKEHCQYISGSVNLKTANPTISIKAILGDGFEVVTFQDGLLWFVKRL